MSSLKRINDGVTALLTGGGAAAVSGVVQVAGHFGWELTEIGWLAYGAVSAVLALICFFALSHMVLGWLRAKPSPLVGADVDEISFSGAAPDVHDRTHVAGRHRITIQPEVTVASPITGAKAYLYDFRDLTREPSKNLTGGNKIQLCWPHRDVPQQREPRDIRRSDRILVFDIDVMDQRIWLHQIKDVAQGEMRRHYSGSLSPGRYLLTIGVESDQRCFSSIFEAEWGGNPEQFRMERMG